jgi:AcrR family transcriptional regulator
MAPRVSKSYKEDIKRRILGAAFREFSLKGYDKTNLDDVARSIGVARGTIYLYFDSKRELFESLSEHQLNRLRRLLSNPGWSDENVEEAARAFFRESKRGLPKNGERMIVELLAESTRNKALKRQRLLESRRIQEVITDAFQKRMRQNSRIFEKEIRKVALGALALYNGLSILSVLGYDDKEIEDSFARTIALVVTGSRMDSLGLEKNAPTELATQ